MSYEMMNGIESIAGAAEGDKQYACGLGTSGSIANLASYTFAIVAQTAFKPERLELVMPELAYGGVTVTAFTIAADNQLSSADAIGAICFHPQVPALDIHFDKWGAGTTLAVTILNTSGSAVVVNGTLFGELA